MAGGRKELTSTIRPRPVANRWFLLRATRYAGSAPLRLVCCTRTSPTATRHRNRPFLQAALLDQIDVSVILIDLDLTVLSWNAGAERLYGWTAKEAIGRPASETILPPESARQAAEGEASIALQSDGRWDGDSTVRRKDGSTFSAHVRSRLIAIRTGT